MFTRLERLLQGCRQCNLTLLLAFVLALSVGFANGESVTSPLPADIASRLAVRASEARKASHNLKAYLLYREAVQLDPSNSNYRENRDELEPIAKLLASENLEKAEVKGDIEAATLEATPGSDASVAVRLAEKAERARKSGQAVRAYLLYDAAAKRYPANPAYPENRNTLAPVAGLLQNGESETPSVLAEIKAAELESLSGHDPSLRTAGADWQSEGTLSGLPHIQAKADHHDFDLRGNTQTLIQQVTSAYGVRAINEPDLPKTNEYTFRLTDADFKTAMEALTLTTNTFVFPVSPQVVFFAEDTEVKRNELEPNVLLTVSLPDSIGDKDLIEVANGVRTVLNLRSFGWDATNHTVMIRDRYTRAHVAKELLQSLLVPHAQVSLELQFVAFDSDVAYHYGLSPQTSFQILSPIPKLFNFNTILPTLVSGAEYFALGGGLTTFGIGVTSAEVFATYTKSIARTFYDTTIVVEDGQAANLHVGEKYPIPQALYTGASQSAPSIYNPIGTFTQEDLGLLLKVTPHVLGNDAVSMEIEADYKALGTETLNTVPSISEREYKGNVTVRQDEWAILAGLDQDTKTSSRSGLAGIGNIPGLNQILSENNREDTKSKTLVVLKPKVTRLSVADSITPQFLVGSIRGVRVML